MYLSRAQLSSSLRAADEARLARASESYRSHQLVWKFFDSDPGADRDFLYRIDTASSPRETSEIFILSERRPRAVTPWNVETKPFEPQLRAGDRLRFSLRVSPTVTKGGKRHDVVMDRRKQLEDERVPRDEWPPRTEMMHTACSDWLEKRAERSGFSLAEDHLLVAGHTEFAVWKRKPGEGRPIQMTRCDFEGILEVDDPRIFLERVEQGFGPGKAFGLGLMLLKRA